MRSMTSRAGCCSLANSELSFIATLSSVICRLEITAFRVSGRAGLAKMDSKIMASVSMARLSPAVVGMPSWADLRTLGWLGKSPSGVKRAGIMPSAVLVGANFWSKAPWRSSSSRRETRRSSVAWLSSEAAAPPLTGICGESARPGTRAISDCCRARSAFSRTPGPASGVVGLSWLPIIVGWAASIPLRSMKSLISA